MPTYNDINLHPISHLPSSVLSRTFDVICIGSGWAANTIGSKLVKASLSVLIVEEELFGGDCPFWACVPSKALLRPAEALNEAATVGGAKEKVDSSGAVDTQAVFQRRDDWVSGWNDDQAIVPFYESTGVTLVRGHGKVVRERRVEVTNRDGDTAAFEANRAVVICTGSEPVIPNIRGLSDVGAWSNREATSTSIVPNRLAILGAGAVGCEMASAFASLGSSVTLISSTVELLPRVDPEASAIVRRSFLKRGVTVHLSTTVKEASKEGEMCTLTCADGRRIQASQILIAAGRKCRTEGHGLEAFGVHTDGSPLVVNESLQVDSVPGRWLYAAGDVNGQMPASHGSKYHGRIISNAILSSKPLVDEPPPEWSPIAATADRFAVPQVVFTHPGVATA